jgi:hypothetical protein
MKTYTASSGYVYQYYFVGQREAPAIQQDSESATEFIFDVTRDRHATFAFSVLLGESALADWASHHGRTLSEPECYAAAKLRLLRGFDELGSADLRQVSRQLPITPGVLEELLDEIGVA